MDKLGDFSMSGLSASNMAESNLQNQGLTAFKPESSGFEDENSLETRLQKIRLGLNIN